MRNRLSRPTQGLTSLLVVLIGGCAGANFHDATQDRSANGIRYYPPATYVLIKPDYSAKAASVTFFQAPDTSKTFAIEPYSFLADNTTEIDFKDGMLSKMDNEADATAVAKSVVAALGEVGKAVLDTAAKASAAAAAAPAVAGRVVTTAPSDVIFLFKVERQADGGIVKQLYPPPG